ncbi:uncharacterized [Tachysurus ichikawai]
MLCDLIQSSLCLHVKALAQADGIMSRPAVKSRIFTAAARRASAKCAARPFQQGCVSEWQTREPFVCTVKRIQAGIWLELRGSSEPGEVLQYTLFIIHLTIEHMARAEAHVLNSESRYIKKWRKPSTESSERFCRRSFPSVMPLVGDLDDFTPAFPLPGFNPEIPSQAFQLVSTSVSHVTGDTQPRLCASLLAEDDKKNLVKNQAVLSHAHQYNAMQTPRTGSTASTHTPGYGTGGDCIPKEPPDWLKTI